MGDVEAVAAITGAVAALSTAAGHLRELDRHDVAHRCDVAAARLTVALTDEVEALEQALRPNDDL